MSEKRMYRVVYDDGRATMLDLAFDEEYGLEGKYLESPSMYATELEAWQAFGRKMAKKLGQRESTLDEIRGLIT